MKSSDRILAQRYAAAYDSLSASDEEARRRYENLAAAHTALAAAGAYMQNPKVTVKQKADLVREALKGEQDTAGFIALLLESKRYGLLDEIVVQARELLDARLGITRAKVISARELDEALKKQTEEAVQARFGGKAEIAYETDPSLIGGLKIWCRGELIDGSLQGRFKKLKEELTK